MALTKLPKNAFGTGSVDSDKIEDGTIQGVDISGSIANDRLANSSITFNGSSTALGGSATLAGYLDWQSVITADGSTTTTAVAGEGYIIDTTSASHTINLPASASIGDTIGIKDYAGTFGTNALVIGRNGHNIQGVANNSQLGTNRASVVLVYVDSTKGWLYTNEHNVGDLGNPLFTEATGGTITTSGDYKIHTFTGDGCFVVSQIGNSPTIPTGGPQTVSYLVIGGGGGGLNSGAGAGGFREGRDIGPSYTASPLVAPTGLTITATTYPITIGAGGTAGGSPTAGGDGNPSIFSSITSAGGGAGVAGTGTVGRPGGSGSGGSNPGAAGGSGNTPPVSPPQGNNGGTAHPSGYPNEGTGGGGGAGAVGGNGGPGSGGSGGNGVSTSITGSSVTRGGGGGAWGRSSSASGGSGGGGDGGPGGTATPGDANTGGGAGGTDGNPRATGGKGIVVIRYKYQ